MNRKGQYFTVMFYGGLAFLMWIFVFAPILRAGAETSQGMGITGVDGLLISILPMVVLAVIVIYILAGTSGGAR